MVWILLVIASALYVSPVWAQACRDVRSIALGGAEVADSRSATETNPAYLTSDSTTVIWTRISPSANYIDGALEATAAASIPIERFQVGFAVDHLGFEDIYAFNEVALDVSARLGNSRAGLAGIRVGYERESYGPSFTPASAVSLNFGARVEPIDHLFLAADAINLVASASKSTALDIGLGYAIEESMLLADARLQDDRVAISFGAEVPIASAIALRVGTSTPTHTLTGGVDVRYDAFHVELGFENHPDLGSAVSLGLRWQDI